MIKKINTSQIRSQLRKIQNMQRTAINNYNRAVRNYNSQVKKVNSQIRKNQQIIKNELNKFNSKSRKNTIYNISVNKLNTCYQNITINYETLAYTNTQQDELYTLIEQENTNSLIVTNALDNDIEQEEISISLNNSLIENKLIAISTDLNDRWNGALFSLNPKNPDATRHFCTSSREIFTNIFDNYAPDNDVLDVFPNCDRTNNGNVTRRWKIKYFLAKKGVKLEGADEFIDNDIENILELYHILSDGTHGNAGRYNFSQLKAIKKRVEDGILFLCSIIV